MATTKENETPNTPSTAATTEATATANDSPALSLLGGSGLTTPVNYPDAQMKDASGSLNVAAVDEEDSGRRGKRRSTSRTRASTNGDASVTKKPKIDSTKKTKTSSKKDQELLDMVWICVACREAECAMDPESELLVCEGPCRRLFHISCAGLPGLPPDDVTWHCHDCQHKKHLCGFCQEYGQDQEDVFKCQKTDCGLFFHEACLEMQNIPVETRVNNGEKREGIEVTDATPSSPNGSGNTAEAPKILQFTCPAHWCWTCTQEDMVMGSTASAPAAENGESKGKAKGKRKKKSTHTVFVAKKAQRLFPCLDCPISYHLTCIPPSAKFHELALLCHEHADTKELPALNMELSLQGNVEAAADQKLQKMQNHDNLLAKRSLARNSVYKSRGSVSRNPFFPAGVTADRRTNKEQVVLSKISESITNVTTKDNTSNGESGGGDENKSVDVNSATQMVVGDGSKNDRLLFCLPADVQEEVHAKPPPYKHIHSLKYYPENRPKKIPTPEDICTCVTVCDDDCINRLLYVECFGSNGTEGDENSSSKKGTNCRLGPNCGNRRLGQRQHVKKCKPASEKGKGWGLVTMENVKKDSLVQEYLGDVIDEKEKERRLKEWSLEHPNDPNFYIMCLSQGWYIDARETANMSRFINHSCNPNCVLQRLNVGGYMRDGIFALRDIKAGEFLSYDYHFDTKLGDKFICRCGSANCRGTMMLKNMKKDAAKKTKSELWNDAKQLLEKDKEFLKEFEARAQRNATVQEVLPGSTKYALPNGSLSGKDDTRRREGEGIAKKKEWVANGVQDKDRPYVIRSRLFLWRNTVLGSDFASRWRRYLVTEGGSGSSSNLLVRRKSSKEKKSRALSASKPIDVISVLQSNQDRAKGL